VLHHATNANSRYKPARLPTSPDAGYAGRKFTLPFTSAEDDPKQSSFLTDDTELTVS
jgi:hypothetical protein